MQLRSGRQIAAGVLVAALVGPLLAVGPALAQGAGPTAVPTLTVTGEGRVDQAPDMARITLGVTTEGPTAAEALAANSAEIAKVIENLKGAGVAPTDLQTTGLALNPNWQSNMDDGTNRIVGYVASNAVSVQVRALDGLGEVLDAAVRDGANTLNGVEFLLQDPDPALDEARKRAVADAQARAALLAGAAGVTLGPIQSISEGGGYQPPVPMMRMASEAKGGVPMAAGSVTTAAQVTIIWALEP